MFRKVYQRRVLSFGPPRKMSRFSLWYMNKFPFRDELERRRNAYSRIYEYLNRDEECPSWIERLFPLLKQSRPLFFPIVVRESQIARIAARKLRLEGIGAAIFWPPPELGAVSNPLYGRILMLPLHKPSIIKTILRNLQNVCA